MKKWLAGAAAALAVTFGSAGLSYADSLNSTLNTTAVDFMFAGDYLRTVSRNATTDLNELVKGGDSRRGVRPNIYVESAQSAINEELAFLKDTGRARKFYSEEQRLDLIGRYQNFLSELNKEKISADAKSLEGLTLASKNGTWETKELVNVSDGLYAVVKEGYDAKAGHYRVFRLVRLTSDKTPAQYAAREKYMEDEYNALAKLESDERKQIEKLRQDLTQAQTPAPQPPALLTPLPPQTTDVPNQGTMVQPEQPVQPQSNPAPVQTQTSAVSGNSLELIIDGMTSLDTFGVRAGLRGKISGLFGLGFTASAAYGLPQTVSSSRTDLSPTGRYFDGSIVDKGAFRASIDAEAYFGDSNGSLFFYIGPTLRIYNEVTSEAIKDISGNTVKLNSNTEAKLVPGIEAGIGYNIKWLRMALGYDSAGKFSGEVGVSIPLGKSENKK